MRKQAAACNAIMQPEYHVTESYVRVMWMQ